MSDAKLMFGRDIDAIVAYLPHVANAAIVILVTIVVATLAGYLTAAVSSHAWAWTRSANARA